MNHSLLGELFAAAREYHGAIAQYAATLRAGGDIENAAQCVVGTSLRYRQAIERVLENDEESLGIVSSRSRLQRLRSMLASASQQYNIVKRPRRKPDQATVSRRSMSWRTVS